MFKIPLGFILVLAFSSDTVQGRVAPDWIHPCIPLSPECLKKTFQEVIPEFTKGYPALGINSTDPLIINYQELELPGGLKISFIDGKITGLRKCTVDSAKFDEKKYTFDYTMHCDIVVKGKYKANGRILIVALNGDGDAKIKANNVVLNFHMKLGEVQRDGETYYELVNSSYKHRFADRVSFSLTNLFKGSPEISKTVLTFLNENWEPIATEFGTPIVDNVVNASLNIVKQFFRVVPKSELFP